MILKQQQDKAKLAQQYSGPGSKPIGSQMMFGANTMAAGGIGGGTMGGIGMGGMSGMGAMGGT